MVYRNAPPLLILAGLTCLFQACGGEVKRPNVLLITVDTLRADRLGCYGYERVTSPFMDKLAGEGVRFEHAYSHAPFTAPSHASLLTSLHTQSHGVLSWGMALTAEAHPMGERFAASGYRTGAFYNHPGMGPSQVTRGFDEVQERYFEEADRTVDAFFEWLDGGQGEFASWVHLWDVHRPYGFRDWRAEYVRPHVPDRGPGELVLAFGEERFGSIGNPLVGRDEGYYNLNAERRASPKQIGNESRPLNQADLRYIVDRYDGGVWYADQGLGRLFDGLAQRGLLDDTIVVLTSDHGEALLEREACYFTHDPFLYEETLRVPLIVRLPEGAQAGRVVGDLVRGIDVLPTLLELCDLPARGGEQGRSLVPLMEGRELKIAPLFAQTQTLNAKERKAKLEAGAGWLEHRIALSDGRYKLIRDASADTWQFYDLAADEGEQRDLSADPGQSDTLLQYRQLFYKLFNGLPRAGEGTGELTPEMEELLEGMGYMGG